MKDWDKWDWLLLIGQLGVVLAVAFLFMLAMSMIPEIVK